MAKALNETKTPKSTETMIPQNMASKSFKIVFQKISEEDSIENKRKIESIDFVDNVSAKLNIRFLILKLKICKHLEENLEN